MDYWNGGRVINSKCLAKLIVFHDNDNDIATVSRKPNLDYTSSLQDLPAYTSTPNVTT